MPKFKRWDKSEFEANAHAEGDKVRFEIKTLDGTLVGSYLSSSYVEPHLRTYIDAIDKKLASEWVDFGSLYARRCADFVEPDTLTKCEELVTAATPADRDNAVCTKNKKHNINAK